MYLRHINYFNCLMSKAYQYCIKKYTGIYNISYINYS